MTARKHAQKASSSPSAAAAAPKITLSGGEAHHSSLVALWRKETHANEVGNASQQPDKELGHGAYLVPYWPSVS